MRDASHLLVVEDDPIFREFLVRTLRRDHRVDEAEDGSQALQKLSREKYDVVLCDLRMPVLSGKDLVQHIRNTLDGETILIVITGYEEDWNPAEATDAHVFAYLKKGHFSPRDLRKVVANGLLLRRERLEKRRYAEELKRLNENLERTVIDRTEALRESEAKYRNLFQQSLVGIYLEGDGRILLGNDRLAEMLGCPPESLENQPVERFILPTDRETGPGLRPGRSDADPRVEEVLLKGPNGELRNGLRCAARVRIRGAEAVQGCILEITEWKDLEQRLHQRQKMESLGTLVSGIAHEFNNILAAMMPQTEILTQRAQELPSIQRPAQILLSMSEKASRLTRQLLNMSRRSKVERECITVNDWIRESQSFLNSTLESSCRIELDLDPNVDQIEGDPQQLDQMMLNLVLNARDAIEEGGKIRIATSLCTSQPRQATTPKGHGASFVEITVEDDGCGIQPEALSRIFDPFFTTKETGKGTGLGLSVVYNLVKQHGGEILVKSRPGKGSTFRVLLPRREPVAPREEALDASPGRILLADRNPQTQHLFRDVLSKMRYEVIPAQNRREAEEIYARQKETIDWVILDSRLARTTEGASLGGFLGMNPHVKLILTHTDPVERMDDVYDSAKEKGARIQFLSMPVTPEGLSLSLAEVLNEKTA